MKDGQEVNIMLSIVRAYDVPVRRKQHQQQQDVSTPPSREHSNTPERASEPKEDKVCSYIEARFQVFTTTTATTTTTKCQNCINLWLFASFPCTMLFNSPY